MLWTASSGFVLTSNKSEMPQLGVLVIKREQVWTGEIAQQLRVLATFADGLGLIPTTMEAHDLFNSSSRRSSALFWPLPLTGTHKSALICVQANCSYT